MRIDDAQLALIATDGERAYPNECCGALFGSGGDVARAMPIENRFDGAEQYHRFQISPQDYMRCEREAVRLGLDLIGFYHSHPDCPAAASEYDRDHALPNMHYLIVSVKSGKAADNRSWVLSGDRAQFKEEEINGEAIHPDRA
jgi:proteasome lid subunit RPN8/RPN11